VKVGAVGGGPGGLFLAALLRKARSCSTTCPPSTSWSRPTAPVPPAYLDELFRRRMEGVAGFELPERLEIVAELATTKVGTTDKKALRADVAAWMGERR
jgi:acyl-CoA synthetase (AMP-forming)/AMP-acid ligase II